MADTAQPAHAAGSTTNVIDLETQRRVRQLMKRDHVDWTAFLRRAVQAYDLMYSQTE